MKCDTCLNARVIISENGYHSSCCLSAKKALDCEKSGYKHFIPKPRAYKRIFEIMEGKR